MENSPYQTFYSSTYKNNSASQINDLWVKAVSKKLAIPYSSNKKILDVACGISTLGFSFGNEVYGMDLNNQAVKVARKNGIKAKQGNVEKHWPYQDNFFDVVIASHIIEHVVNPDHLVLEARRVLKKGGYFIVATPNLASWYNRVLLFLGFQPFFTEVSTLDKTLGITFTRKLTPLREPLGHLRVFTKGALIDILKLHKFKIRKVAGVEFLSFPFLLVLIDKVFSEFASLSSNVIILAKK